MTIDDWYSIARVAAVSTGIVFGSAAFGSACYVWVKKQAFGLGGSVLCGFGTILLGLSIWQSIDLTVNNNGISFQTAKELRQSNQTAIESLQKAKSAASASATAAANAAAVSESPEAKLNAEKAAKAAASATSASDKALQSLKSFQATVDKAISKL